MLKTTIFVLTLLLANASISLAQMNQSGAVGIQTGNNNPQMESIQNISTEISKISKSVESLSQQLKSFFEKFTSNQGLRLTDRQQKLLIAFEFLNRAEQRLAVLQNLKVDLSEKLTAVKARLGKLEEQSRPEDIDRNIAVVGTTNAEELRTLRRQTIYRERNDLTSLQNEVQTSLSDVNAEIKIAETYLKNLRRRLFPEIEKELLDL